MSVSVCVFVLDLPSLEKEPPLVLQTRGETKGSKELSALKFPIWDVNSLWGEEAISFSSFASALFIPETYK